MNNSTQQQPLMRPTIRNAHRIFVLDKGVLREQGRHEEMVATNGIYAALWRVQTGKGVLA